MFPESVSNTMHTESVSNHISIWASMNSWLTPTILFVLLNIMIGTILLRTNLLTQKQNTQQQEQEDEQEFQNDHYNPKLLRSPSVLKRLKSINFRNFRSQEAAFIKQTLDQETQTTLIFEQTIITQAHEKKNPLKKSQSYEEEEEEDDDEPQSLDDVYSHLGHEFTDSTFSRTTSDSKPASGQIPTKLRMKMKKSASMKSPFTHFEESDIVETRRPATVKEGKTTEPDEEVDAKADDFINKFKKQLKLQRMNSIIRYKEVISRGSEM